MFLQPPPPVGQPLCLNNKGPGSCYPSPACLAAVLIPRHRWGYATLTVIPRRSVVMFCSVVKSAANLRLRPTFTASGCACRKGGTAHRGVGGQNVGHRTLTLYHRAFNMQLCNSPPPTTTTRLGEAWEEAPGTQRSLSLSGGRAEGQARAQI